MTGKYPVLCRKAELSPTELQQVAEAERRENLRVCLTGKYKVLCKKQLLTPAELEQTLNAERAQNLRVCLTGSFPVLCDKSLLNSEQLSQAIAAEQQAGETRRSITRTPRRSGGGLSGCEDGHWIESVSGDGGIVKLEDGSIWEVDPADAIDSALWLPVTDIWFAETSL
jgi:hypothetical protein